MKEEVVIICFKLNDTHVAHPGAHLLSGWRGVLVSFSFAGQCCSPSTGVSVRRLLGQRTAQKLRDKLIGSFKLAGAQLLFNISGKDAEEGHKGDGASHVVAFGVDFRANDRHCWPVVCMQCGASGGHCPLHFHIYFPTPRTCDSLPEMSCCVRMFADIVRNSFVSVQLFLNGSIFD